MRPADDYLSVSFTNGLVGSSVILMNILGRVLKVIPVCEKETTLDIKGFKTGIYLIRINKDAYSQIIPVEIIN